MGPGPDLNNPDVIPPPESPNVPPPEIPTSAPSPDSGGGGGGGGGGLSGGTPNRVDQSLFGYDLPNFVGINYQAPARNELDRIIRESLLKNGLMTYVQLVNSVLRRLRENEVTTVQSDNYSKLIGDLVNDAKDVVESAWDWSALRTTLAINTVSVRLTIH